MQNHPERIHNKDLKKVSAIGSATRQMSRLIEDLLFLARSDAHPSLQPRSWRPLSLEEILQDLAELFAPSAAAAAVPLEVETPEDAVVMGDRDQLHRLFANLLRNAIEHTPPNGSVTITLSAVGNIGQVSIRDTGVGIPVEKQALVFQRFWRGDRSRSQPRQGSGLGLPIACAIAQQHGGQIALTSEVGQGSCFTVSLPITTAGLSFLNK